MIYLGNHRPQAPAEFQAEVNVESGIMRKQEKLKNAQDTIRKIVTEHTKDPTQPLNVGRLENGDFNNLWKDYCGAFRSNAVTRKCNYCEFDSFAAVPGNIDHFRPKTQVREPRNKGNRNDLAGPPKRTFDTLAKPGYWWLAYSWDNWIYACTRCNSIWKLDQFPLRNPKYPLVEGCEAQEEALLINPYQEDPSEHLSFTELGEIQGVSDKGKETISVCGLDRESLIKARQKAAQLLLNHIEEINQYSHEKYFNRLWEFCKDEAQFAGMARDLLEDKTGVSYKELKQIVEALATNKNDDL